MQDPIRHRCTFARERQCSIMVYEIMDFAVLCPRRGAEICPLDCSGSSRYGLDIPPLSSSLIDKLLMHSVYLLEDCKTEIDIFMCVSVLVMNAELFIR